MLHAPSTESGQPPRTGLSALQAAVEALRSGDLAVFPTETLYGLGVSATSERGVARLRELTRSGDRTSTGAQPLTWHLPDTSALFEHLELPTPVHRRLLTRLLPGPVRFLIEQPAGQLAAMRQALGIPEGLIDDGTHLSVRVIDHPTGGELLARVAQPVIAERLGAAEGFAPDLGTVVGNVPRDIAVIDAGPTRLRRPSSSVRVAMTGAFDVLTENAVSAAGVMAALKRRLLFVCTGNTCRSPMAEAIASDLFSSRPEDGISTEVRSAGVTASGGGAASPEAMEAMSRLGLDLGGHRSTALTGELIDWAERIYTMTDDHRRAVVAMRPDASSKVERLDEAEDVPDPFGGPIEDYVRTADRLLTLVKRRAAELERRLAGAEA